MTTSNIRPFKGIVPNIGKSTYIDSSSVLVCDINIGDNVSIQPLVTARGVVNSITVGCNTNIQDGTIFHVTLKTAANLDGHPLIIGSDVTVGHHCMLHGCQLVDRILVGMGAIIKK